MAVCHSGIDVAAEDQQGAYQDEHVEDLLVAGVGKAAGQGVRRQPELAVLEQSRWIALCGEFEMATTEASSCSYDTCGTGREFQREFPWYQRQLVQA